MNVFIMRKVNKFFYIFVCVCLEHKKIEIENQFMGLCLPKLVSNFLHHYPNSIINACGIMLINLKIFAPYSLIIWNLLWNCTFHIRL